MEFIASRLRSSSKSGGGTVRSGNLRGIDSTAAENEKSLCRADGLSYFDGTEQPGTVNMIRTALGQVSKRPGYKLCGKAGGFDVLGGVFAYSSPEITKYFYISADQMAIGDGTYSMTGTSDSIISLPDNFNGCLAFQAEDCMFFLNGYCIFVYRVTDNATFYADSHGNTSVQSSADDFAGYIPTLFVGNLPTGAGSAYEAVNLISPYVSEQFISDGSSTQYTVHLDIKSGSTVSAYIKNESGVWESLTVQSATGTAVTFAAAPAATAVSGEDNIKIVYAYASYAANVYKIAKCRWMTTYGVGGYNDRVFLAGNEKAANTVFFSEMDRLLYFPDLNYIKVGASDTEVISLARDDTRLAVICNDCVYLVSGSEGSYGTETDYIPSALFLISGTVRTPKPSMYAIPQYFDNEVLYLTHRGVAAISPSGVLDERCCQIRSAMINYHLLKEDLPGCDMITCNDFLIVSNRCDTLYLLDAKQYSSSSSEPFSMRQYDGYIWKNIDAEYMWLQDGTLYFSNGRYVYCFNSDFESNSDYSDETGIKNGEIVYSTINAYWESPQIYCQSFHINKFFDRVGALLASRIGDDGAYLNTDIKILARFDNGDWRVIRDYSGDFSVFRYGNVSYDKFSYSDRPKSFALVRRLNHKKGKSIKLRFENNNCDQPFTLQNFLVEYSIM